ncbi:MAG: NADAR family protein [Micrococcales bacterium]|nr:NADAR family protein [Micrococcales bacterium]
MTTIRFYSANGEYGCFSNFSLHPTLIDGVLYSTTEHYFQSQKFTDESVRRRVRAARTPQDAARLGRDRALRLRRGWESMKDEVMLRAVRAKIDQHHDVRQALLSTGDALIVEHTQNDDYWGDGGDGSGKNRLGKILMKVRSEILSDGRYSEA